MGPANHHSTRITYTLIGVLWCFLFSLPQAMAAQECIVSWRSVEFNKKSLACKMRSSKNVLGTIDRRGRFRAIASRQIKTAAIKGRRLERYLRTCRKIDPQKLDSRKMMANIACSATEPAPPPPIPGSTPTAAPTHTVTPTPTFTAPPAPRIYLSENSIDFGTVGFNETRHRSLLVRQLPGITGTSNFQQIQLTQSSGISLLSPSQAAARGAVACSGTLDRFCVVVLQLDASSIGSKNAVLSIRYADASNPSVILTSTVPIFGQVQTAPTVSDSMFRTVSLRAAAAAQNLGVKAYLDSEFDRLAPPSYESPNDARLFSAFPSWNNNWANSLLDFSGVAWDRHEGGIAITRCHVAMATHFQRSGSIRFHRKDGTFADRSIIQLASVAGSDITIGKLSECLPPDWTVYPLLSSENASPFGYSELYGAPYVTTHFKFSDQIRRLSLLGFAGFNATSGWTLPNRPPLTQCGANFMCDYPNVGDSGHPGFLIINGELVLVSQWWTTGGGPNYAYPSVQAAVRAAVLSLP